MTDYNAYETVVGLEVHAQLKTASKLFCGDSTVFGAEPNTNISPLTLAHPGTLPRMNRKAVEYAVKMGLACHCRIIKQNYFARKNYFYPDLPKGYQVSQHTTPICSGGYVKIKTGSNEEKRIRLNRIHLEEDAGKSIHDADENSTCVDYNRAGTPLTEIVTEPDIRSGDEAFAYLTEIRRLVRYLDICDGNMEEGSLRYDANIPVRKKGETVLGTRVEVKNLNSIRHVKRAIEAEAKRLIEILDNGGVITQETRSFDAGTGTTFAIRDKEDADDYRYFPEPDLTPFSLDDDFINQIQKNIPALQEERIKKYTAEYKLSLYDATVIAEERAFADYFESIVAQLSPLLDGVGGRPKAAANWMLGPVKNWLNKLNSEIDGFPLAASAIAGIISLVESGKLSFSTASSRLFPMLLNDPAADPEELAEKNNLLQESDLSSVGPVIDNVLKKFADKVAEYKKGKKGLLALFAGEVIKQTKGKADPKMTHELLIEKLKK
ncbi:MAG: Asp-tRNA(Asn)/Glu-tRNA(Gln) amidotransferase subunit GatB [Bacteroidetes bacterium]|nr:Asp-tRNA(Asn)/Glu-tRNA(Gln) amidotransferase subunit GatB [Bacteroidota bacterium]